MPAIRGKFRKAVASVIQVKPQWWGEDNCKVRASTEGGKRIALGNGVVNEGGKGSDEKKQNRQFLPIVG